MDRLHLINVFVSVVDANGFAGAARKLNISPPAVTRAISELEAHLGVRLLTRTTRVVRVTEAGARYVEDCRRILAELAEADESVSGLHASPRGRLTLTAPALFGALFVTPIVTEYLQRYPEVTASCWFLDRVVNMVDEGVDIGVRIGELPDSSLQAIRVGRVRRVICAAPSYLKRHGAPQTPDDLTAHTIVSASGVTPTPEWRLVENGAPKLVKLQPRMTTTTNDSAVAAAVAGFGLTRLMSYQVAEHVREGRLQVVLSEFETAPLPVHLVHREGRHASQKARAFLDLAIERLRASKALD
ncbi:LysR family transcriptional regulator [Paucibacter sp. DJ2R-2]|uniref:LysR family transcriptional regulator n=1 Tax=Paucibacter sp. DJ2R-2 TaxID=2893558 RepID=UPI0021E4F2A3|nr:LysR family transcriptional regulator [Paucibacter sp. DJ2R-2]MCV2419914.1 LysR family transcriptional regulator [Paucibacter sp. DJ4R-1]MCV2437159.1 LysR family transcriptional regulator [Paucibacter sp. DJ2R-2]